ncbi:twin-arginine translocase TatA/TatE family subunit [Helicobacter sp. MIT 03-1614]|jgi:sec-independent protein translocase protein TatA|uniref:Sec-independent protein translocase protein TatA n=1 Tax=Helicobacter hepaticus (strain ATCC 51449 / 3B1) TaxID=235279 RepID=TATA_HELHP|nr:MULTISPECIES: twin-arginine translocase TatA/TatE family subunit [Helicobacter]Q7VIA0.1 RecName: Full=Sec-independent protein translocase protein TatA [Helicobacter hepaticus ATCC 51449]AAP77305.1 component of Sec-independent protein secretion pathway TatA [Helicobacter hepaticus ATCC 51449]TLD89923.1 twin-arginine translocase TatA/TatE family subunit [Helicobacter sp. MIT 03-1614]
MHPPSITQLLIILLIIVLLFGAKKIPELAKGLGSGIKNFKKAVKEDEEDNQSEENTKSQIKQSESKNENVSKTHTDSQKQDT